MEKIKEDAVVGFIEENRNFFKTENFSFFEMTVGMAFNYFAKEEVDVAVIEVGLGGRLDSTNIITPVLSVITNIGFDHTAMLGNELSQIAGEKAGIIKDKTPVVIGEIHPETIPVFRRIAKEKNAPLIVAKEWTDELPVTDLKGSYQKRNLATVSTAVEALRNMDWRITSEAFREGVGHTIRNTNLRGRWEILRNRPKVICDTAHNKEGLQYVLQQLQEEDFEMLHIVLGVVNDKDLSLVLPLFPKTAKYYFSRPNIPRGLEADILKDRAAEFGLSGRSYSSVSKAYGAALENAAQEDVIYVGGSTFTVAEII